MTKKMLGISSERETEGEILVVVEHKIIEALLHINVRQDEDRLCYWNVFANVRFSNEAVIQFPSKLFDLHVRVGLQYLTQGPWEWLPWPLWGWALPGVWVMGHRQGTATPLHSRANWEVPEATPAESSSPPLMSPSLERIPQSSLFLPSSPVVNTQPGARLVTSPGQVGKRAAQEEKPERAPSAARTRSGLILGVEGRNLVGPRDGLLCAYIPTL